MASRLLYKSCVLLVTFLIFLHDLYVSCAVHQVQWNRNALIQRNNIICISEGDILNLTCPGQDVSVFIGENEHDYDTCTSDCSSNPLDHLGSCLNENIEVTVKDYFDGFPINCPADVPDGQIGYLIINNMSECLNGFRLRIAVGNDSLCLQPSSSSGSSSSTGSSTGINGNGDGSAGNNGGNSKTHSPDTMTSSVGVTASGSISPTIGHSEDNNMFFVSWRIGEQIGLAVGGLAFLLILLGILIGVPVCLICKLKSVTAVSVELEKRGIIDDTDGGKIKMSPETSSTFSTPSHTIVNTKIQPPEPPTKHDPTNGGKIKMSTETSLTFSTPSHTIVSPKRQPPEPPTKHPPNGSTNAIAPIDSTSKSLGGKNNTHINKVDPGVSYHNRKQEVSLSRANKDPPKRTAPKPPNLSVTHSVRNYNKTPKYSLPPLKSI